MHLEQGSGAHFTRTQQSEVKVSGKRLFNEYLQKSTPGSTEAVIKHSTGFKCSRPYLSSSVPRLKTKNLTALQRARSSLCLAFEANVLKEVFLDPPMLLFNFSFKFTVKQRKNLQPKCFTLLQDTFSKDFLPLSQPLCQAVCPQGMGDDRKWWGSISITDIAQI